MSAQLNLSMQEMAKLALGGERVTNVNIAVLHSLINLILKKLNCQDETVSIGGYESKCLEKLLKRSKTSPLIFNDDKVELLIKKLEQFPAMEERISKLDKKLQKHFSDIRQCHRIEQNKDNPFDFAKWEVYESICEDLCSFCEPENQIGCDLLKNVDFMRKFMRRISKPVVDRIFELEQKIVVLGEELDAAMKRIAVHYTKIDLVEKCIYEIETLRRKIDHEHVEFIRTMEEVQEMLDAKLDKIHMPAMKKWITDRLKKIESDLSVLQILDECPKAAGIVLGNVSCLSCGVHKVCAELGAHPVGLLPEAKQCKYMLTACRDRKPPKPPCTCGAVFRRTEPTLMERMVQLDVNATEKNYEERVMELQRGHRKKQKEQFKSKCKLQAVRNEHLMGEDGNLYYGE